MSYPELKALRNRVQFIYESCGGRTLVKQEETKDAFYRTKTELVEGLERLRELVADRENGGMTNREQIQNRMDINKQYREVQVKSRELRQLLEKEKTKKKSKVPAEELERREALVEALEEQTSADVTSATGIPEEVVNKALEIRLDTQSGELIDSSGRPISAPRGASVEELTDEHKQQLALIDRTRTEQNQTLDEISSGVGRLKELAVGMNEEITVQNIQLETVEKDVDKANDHMKRVNNRMEDALKMVNSKTDKFCMYSICCIILLGLLVVVYNMAT